MDEAAAGRNGGDEKCRVRVMGLPMRVSGIIIYSIRTQSAL